jgi:hypothetical protein
MKTTKFKNCVEGEREEFLRLERLPAILYDFEAGWILGFTAEEVGCLVAKDLLRPLGRPGKSDSKRFAREAVVRLKVDVDWLDKASRAIYSSRRTSEVPDRPVEAPAPAPRPKPSKAGASGNKKAAFHQVELLPFIPPCEEGTKTAE